MPSDSPAPGCGACVVLTIICYTIVVSCVPAVASEWNAFAQATPRAEAVRLSTSTGMFSLRGQTITGNWGGLRDELSDAGVRVYGIYNHYYQKALQGGSELEGSGRNSGSMDLLLEFDLGKLGMVKSSQLLVHARRQWGAGINPIIGALQQVNDDADGDRTLHIDQLWYQTATADGRLTLRLGFLDFQTIVDRNAFANSEDVQFWNQAFDNTPVVPFIPQAGLGFAVIYRPARWYTAIVGLHDAASVLFKPGFSTAFHGPAHYFVYAENGFHVAIPSDNGPLEGNYRIGLAYDPRPTPVFNARFTNPQTRAMGGGDYIFYTSMDQMITRETGQSAQGLGWFLRYGYRDSETSRVEHFLSTGVQYRGLLPGRDKDVVGVGLAAQFESGDYRRHVNARAAAETIYEFYYAIALTDWLVVTPDVQYITHPGGDAGNADALVVGLRTRLSF